MATEAQMKSEIARLSAFINMHKAQAQPAQRRGNTYVNPSYRPPPPKAAHTGPTSRTPTPQARPSSSAQPKEVVLNGVAFQSSSRSLVRKDLPKPPSTSKPASSLPPPIYPASSRPLPIFARKSGHSIPNHRQYKPTGTRGRRGRGRGGPNMTLNNTRRPYKARKEAKRLKYSDKPCPRFSTTGSCSRGLTCMYQHNPDKIAICWNYLQDKCSKTAETCELSHDPTPERTPLCVHFVNKGRCTRTQCPYPHVNVGARSGVCRDFAVLGYCEKGLDCDHQHVRECPDFAENGSCTIKGCKLPHVIRANRNRKAAPSVLTEERSPAIFSDPNPAEPAPVGQLGDEYISLTFNESDSDGDDEEDDDEEEVDDDEDEENDDDDEEPERPPTPDFSPQ